MHIELWVEDKHEHDIIVRATAEIMEYRDKMHADHALKMQREADGADQSETATEIDTEAKSYTLEAESEKTVDVKEHTRRPRRRRGVNVNELTTADAPTAGDPYQLDALAEAAPAETAVESPSVAVEPAKAVPSEEETVDALRALCATEGGFAKATTILSDLGVKRVGELNESQRAAFCAAAVIA